MATPKINENCHYVQDDHHKFKIKLGKFHFDILCRFGVIKESLPGGQSPRPSGEIGLRSACRFLEAKLQEMTNIGLILASYVKYQVRFEIGT